MQVAASDAPALRRGPLGLTAALWGNQTDDVRPFAVGARMRSNPGRGGPRTRSEMAVEELRGLARERDALCVRLAMLLACLWRMDLSDLGFTSRGAFLGECIDLGTTWARRLVRLIESPLALIERGVARGAVPLREAVEAPGNVEPEPQLAWILGLGRAAASEEPSSPEVAIGGDDASAVLEARRRARILVGRRVNNQEVDAFIVSVYERKVPLDELRSQARVRPAAPPEPGALAWDWCADEAPAQRALGPWTEPADPTEAIAQVEALKRQRGGAAKLVPAWIDADHGAVWAELGYASRCAFARAVCGWSRRTAQRRARVGWALEWYPAPDAAVRSGMGLGTAEALVPVLDERNVHRWLAVASRTSRRDRMDLVSAAHVEARVGATLARTESAIAAADAWQAKGGSPSTAPSAGDVSSDGPPAAAPPAGDAPDGPPNAAPSAGDAPDGSPPAAPSAGDAPDGSPAAAPSAGDAPLGVSLARPDAPTAPDERAARSVRATEELVEAARWWLAHVVLPPQRGVTKVKERDGYTCQNPECRRRTLRFEAHHEPPAPRAAATTRPTCSASVDRATCGACTPGPQSTPRASPPPRRPSAPPRHPPDLRGTKADSAAAGRARPSRPRWPVTPTSS